MQRINAIDGLRAFAVLGVIWAHVWMFFGNIPWKVAGVDVNKIMSFGGIGVDLFFVISGFCMYLMYHKKAADFTLGFYWSFIVKRWKRIAPAFYFIVLFESVLYLINNGLFPTKSFVYHLLFINTFNKDNVLSPPFWSLAVEWHFYLVLPFLFIKDTNKKFIGIKVLALIGVCIALRMWHYSNYNITSTDTVPAEMIWYRFAEFGWGILAAKRYITGPAIPRLFRGNTGFLMSLCIAFLGRICMTGEFCSRFGVFAFVIRAMGEPILTLGFALMILTLLKSENSFQKLLSVKPLLFIGRISYSMYLWHWIICVAVSYGIMRYYSKSAVAMELAFLISVIILIPISFLSYKLLEASYFKRGKGVQMDVNKK
jgi:peptidoglycan/LPS O-acetylase OafA/YrhL